MNDFLGRRAVGHRELVGSITVPEDDVLSAVRELESAALDFALIHVEDALDRVLREGKIGSNLLAGFALTIFIAVSAYGILFEALSFLTLAIWPSITGTGAGLLSHGIILFMALVCMVWHRVAHYGRTVADATH